MSDRLHEAVTALDDYRSCSTVEQDEPDLFTQLESVAAHEGNAWKDQALDLLHVIASTKRTFTVEDLDRHLPPTIDKRAVGWVLRRGARSGWFHAIGYENGGPKRHGRPVVLWQSDIDGSA